MLRTGFISGTIKALLCGCLEQRCGSGPSRSTGLVSIVGSQDRDEGCSSFLHVEPHTVVNMQTALAVTFSRTLTP